MISAKTHVTILKAARHLGVNPHYMKGLVEGMRIETHRVGRIRVLAIEDLPRLHEAVIRSREEAAAG